MTNASAQTWRLLVTEPADGPTNMAIDEAIWRGRQATASPPTIRFFAWEPPTVSLGYGQPLGRDVDVDACRRLGVGIVRRPTGGSAIYHDGPERELTYSVIGSNDDLGVAPDLLQTYRWIALALRRGLRQLGAAVDIVAIGDTDGPPPPFCFARTGRYELEIAGKKVVGSAQRRQGVHFLQHGSVLLGVDASRLRTVFPTTSDPLATLTTLEAALGQRPKFDDVAAVLGEAFEAEHRLALRPGGLSSDEAADVDRLVRDKYATDAWLVGA
jgi:lipoyl(octanoyl) transferase